LSHQYVVGWPIAEALFVETISQERFSLGSGTVTLDHIALLWDCYFTYYSACWISDFNTWSAGPFQWIWKPFIYFSIVSTVKYCKF